MAYGFDKERVKEQITFDDVFEFLMDFGGEPFVRGGIIVSRTICHHSPDEDCSHKLYYYQNSGLFQCYTGGCAESSFDLFQLVIKVHSIQKNTEIDLNGAILYVAGRLGIAGENFEFEENQLADWQVFSDYEKIKQIREKVDPEFKFEALPFHDPTILTRFSYLPINPWLRDGISLEVMKHNLIGYYAGEEQITIPHFDARGALIGIRGRALVKEEAELYGKYRPLRVNKILYNHPLSKNLYNINNSKNNIELAKKAIIFESEKSCLQYASYFGIENDISVACCGSHFSTYQCELLLDLGVDEIILALDRQFQEVGDDEYRRLTKNIEKIKDKYKNYVNVSAIFDKNMITNYKDSPTDLGPEKFFQLFKERIKF